MQNWSDHNQIFIIIQENFNQRMHSGNDNLSQLQSQVNEVRDVMTQNIEKVLQRGENLEDLMDKTTDLEQHVSSSGFNT